MLAEVVSSGALRRSRSSKARGWFGMRTPIVEALVGKMRVSEPGQNLSARASMISVVWTLSVVSWERLEMRAIKGLLGGRFLMV